MSTTSTENPLAATVRGFYDALARGDVEAIPGMMSPEITLRMPGRSPLAGLYTGRDSAVGFLGQMQAAAGGTFRAELRDLYSSDTQVVAIHHGTGTRGEKTLDADAALVFEVSAGVVTGVAVHQRSQDHWDEFFGEPI